MGDIHYHFSIENILYTGFAAWLFLNLVKIIAAFMVNNPAMAGFGKMLAGTIKF